MKSYPNERAYRCIPSSGRMSKDILCPTPSLHLRATSSSNSTTFIQLISPPSSMYVVLVGHQRLSPSERGMSIHRGSLGTLAPEDPMLRPIARSRMREESKRCDCPSQANSSSPNSAPNRGNDGQSGTNRGPRSEIKFPPLPSSVHIYHLTRLCNTQDFLPAQPHFVPFRPLRTSSQRRDISTPGMTSSTC